MIPERSIDAKSAKSVFFRDVNDIDIYIEDTAKGYEKIFNILLSRVFQDKYKVKKVFPLGGRKEVIEQYHNHSSTRPFLYIIDGDLFLLIGDTVSSKQGLYKLPFYCIENILCHHDSIIQILYEEEVSNQDINQLRDLFDYNDWELKNKEKLFELFIEYTISMNLNPKKQTVSYKCGNLVSGNRGIVDNVKIQNRIDYIRQSIIDECGKDKYDETKNYVLSMYEQSSMTELDIVSGKDYLFPLLKVRARATVKTTMKDINFKQRLAMICDITKILDMENYIGL